MSLMRHSFFFYILDMFNTLRAHGCWLCALFFSFSLHKKNFFSLQLKKNRLYSPINKNPVNTGLYRHPKNFPFGCIDWTVFTKDNNKSLPHAEFYSKLHEKNSYKHFIHSCLHTVYHLQKRDQTPFSAIQVSSNSFFNSQNIW